jgi:hypothetical protein
LNKKPNGVLQEHATNFNPVNVSAVIFKDNSNVILTTMFADEPSKSQMWQYERKKTDHAELSQPAIVSVYSHFQNVDFLNRNTRRFLTEIQREVI